MGVLGWEPMVWECDGCGREFTAVWVQTAETEGEEGLPEFMDGQDRTWCERCKLRVFGPGLMC